MLMVCSGSVRGKPHRFRAGGGLNEIPLLGTEDFCSFALLPITDHHSFSFLSSTYRCMMTEPGCLWRGSSSRGHCDVVRFNSSSRLPGRCRGPRVRVGRRTGKRNPFQPLGFVCVVRVIVASSSSSRVCERSSMIRAGNQVRSYDLDRAMHLSPSWLISAISSTGCSRVVTEQFLVLDVLAQASAESTDPPVGIE